MVNIMKNIMLPNLREFRVSPVRRNPCVFRSLGCSTLVASTQHVASWELSPGTIFGSPGLKVMLKIPFWGDCLWDIYGLYGTFMEWHLRRFRNRLRPILRMLTEPMDMYDLAKKEIQRAVVEVWRRKGQLLMVSAKMEIQKDVYRYYHYDCIYVCTFVCICLHICKYLFVYLFIHILYAYIYIQIYLHFYL